MNQGRFDRVTRIMATASSRRGALKSLAGTALGVGAVAVARPAQRAAAIAARLPAADADERGILLYELFAVTLEGADGDCGKLADAANKFMESNRALLADIEAEEEAMSDADRKAVHEKYADRKNVAGKTIVYALNQCGYGENSTSPLCGAGGEAGTPVADAGRMGWTAAQTDAGDPLAGCSGCDCNCICPISWYKCISYGGGCAGGSHSSCCWAAMCATCHSTCSSSQCCQFVH